MSPRLSAADARKVADFREFLRTLTTGGPPVLAAFVSEFRDLTGAEEIIAYGISVPSNRVEMDFLYAAGTVPQAKLWAGFNAFAAKMPQEGMIAYDPLRLDRAQRFVAPKGPSRPTSRRSSTSPAASNGQNWSPASGRASERCPSPEAGLGESTGLSAPGASGRVDYGFPQ